MDCSSCHIRSQSRVFDSNNNRAAAICAMVVQVQKVYTIEGFALSCSIMSHM